jgi:hypothetical protein
VVPESPSPEEPGEGNSGPIGVGTGGGEGGGAATSPGDESTETEQAPVVEGPLAAAAEDVRDPRASIGDINCTNLTVPVTLDNSRSTKAALYEIFAGDADGDEPTLEKTVAGPAGAIQIIDVAITEDTQFALSVYDRSQGDDLEDRILTFALLAVDCSVDDDSHHPQARIGGLDCASMTIDATLDNSRSEDETTYLVTVFGLSYEEPTYEKTFTVPAGLMQTIPVPVTENSAVVVAVGDNDALEETGGEEGDLARELFRVDCTPHDGPRASIGEVDCMDLSVTVTLDNTSSVEETTFLVLSDADPEGQEYFHYEEDFDVAAGTEQSVPVPLRDHAEVAVLVADSVQYLNLGDTFAFELLDVDCVDVAAGRAGPRLADGELAATGANGLTLPIMGLTLLACGGVLSMLGRRHS